MRILLVEDEVKMSEAVSFILKEHHYVVDAVFDGESAYRYGLEDLYDVIILDVMLPKMNGIEVLKKLRAHKINTPIIMLSAKGDLSDRILGLNHGADDYLPKPFQSEELLARIRALTRRRNDILYEEVLSFGNLFFNPKTLELSNVHKSFELTLKESQMIEYLMVNKNSIISKEMFIDKLWGFDDEVNDNTVEVYISFLRKKLKSMKSDVSIITKRNIGYSLGVQEDEDV